MSFRAYCVLCLILVIFGLAVSPIAKSEPEPPNIEPAPPKKAGQSQEDYAQEILGGRTITEFPPAGLPIPDITIPKTILTDDSATVEGILKNGEFVARVVETWVIKIEDNTAFRLSLQNYWNNFLVCIQRIRIYEELETPEQLAKRLAENSGKNPYEGQSSKRITGNGAVASASTPVSQGVASSRTPIPQGVASSRTPVPQGVASSRTPVPQGVASSRTTVPQGVASSRVTATTGASSARTGSGGSSGGTASQTSTKGKEKEKENKPKLPPRRKFKDTPREDILAKCEGGFEFKPHTRYRFGFADAIFFFGANRIIYKMQTSNPGDPACHERSYTIAGKRDKFIDEQQCKIKIERIFTREGTLKNLLWNLLHHPLSFVTGRAFKE